MTTNYFSGLSKNTFLLTFVSFFADISTEMLYPILPIFVTQTLGASVNVVGLIEGTATATQNIVQGFSGILADNIRRRKRVALFGYLLAAFSKPIMGIGNIWQVVLIGRFSDRFGTGMRSAPRDALIAESADNQDRGKAFGLEGIGDNAGAFVGPLLAILLLFTLHIPIRSIFYLALIPGLLAFFLILLVKEKQEKLTRKFTLHFSVKEFSSSYWQYISITILFGLGNISSSFLILRANSEHIPFILTIAIYACFNLVAALTSYPAGTLSDRLGRKSILLICFVTALVTFVGFAASNNLIIIAALFILYGVTQGTFRAVGKSLATDLVPQQLRASGIGWYATAVGISGLIANFIGGQLWTISGSSFTFWYASFFVFLGTIALLVLLPTRQAVDYAN